MKKARSVELVNENVTQQPGGTGTGSKSVVKSNGSSTIKFRVLLNQNHLNSVSSSMAGDVPTECQKMPRKTWALQDRSALSVHLLKTNLAEDGCEEAQLDIAKSLMQESEDETAGVSLQRENARKATYWLIRSAEQGNEEATNLLKQLLKSGIGITCQNISDVRSCVNTPRNEKLVFKAARRLYDKLSNGEEFITTTQIQEYCLNKEAKEQQRCNETLNVSDDMHNSTFTVDNEDDNDGASNEDSNPTSPLNNQGQSGRSLYTANELEHLVNQEAVKLTRKDLLKVATSYNSGEVPHISIDVKRIHRFDWNLFSLTNAFLLQFLMLAVFTKALTLHTIIILLASFISLWTAFCLGTWRHRLSVVDDWTSAFKSVLQNNPVSDFASHQSLIRKQVQPLLLTTSACFGTLHVFDGPPYLVMALAILTLLGIYRGVLNYQLQWQSRFAILSLFLSSPIFSQVFQQIILAVDSYLNEILPRETLDALFKDVDHFLPAIDFQMAVIVVNLAVIAESYLHTPKTSSLLMQLVIFAWWFKLISIFSHATLFSNYVAASTAVFIGVTFCMLESNKGFWKISAWISAALVILAVACVAHSVITESDSLHGVLNNGNSADNQLSWQEYNENCHRKAWKTKSIGQTQFDCVLKYECAATPTFVTWTGKISVIKITNIEKSRYSRFINTPMNIKDVFFEILVNVEHNPATTEDGSSSWSTLLTRSSNEKETLSIVSVSVSTKNVEIGKKLKTVHRLLDLRPNDIVEFHGVLLSGSGGLKPEIGQVKMLKCLNCAASDFQRMYFTRESLLTTSIFGSAEDYLGSQFITLLSETEIAFRNYFKITLEYIKQFSS